MMEYNGIHLKDKNDLIYKVKYLRTVYRKDKPNSHKDVYLLDDMTDNEQQEQNESGIRNGIKNGRFKIYFQ